MISEKYGLYEKEQLLHIINSDEFKELFLKFNITNIILFGSITSDSFNCESDIDIAVISNSNLGFTDELKLTQQLEALLKRDVDIIDIKDSNINNMIKISALNSKAVILKDELWDQAIEFYDNLCRENEEFWRILDRVVLNIE